MATGSEVSLPGAARAVVAHLGSRQAGHVIYGSIVGLALVVALEPHPPAAGAMVAIVASTGLAVALAELYSDVVGTRVRLRHALGRHMRREILESAAAVGAGAAFPATFFVLAAAGVLELDTAFEVAKWSGLGLIALYGFAGARLGGAQVGHSLLHALAVGAIGALVIVIKAIVH